MTNPPPSLVREVEQRFGVGPRFAEAYLAYWFGAGNPEAFTLDQVLALPSPQPMWFEYALSTNWRAEQIRQAVLPKASGNAARYLDVGCGFGGCLVAFAKAGLEVVGIETDATCRDLAAANCADHQLRDCVHAVSILEAGLPGRIGRFDVITCIDVIEHVDDPGLALHNMVDLLKPGGLLALEIPNKDSLAFVAQDGHFGLFGITLLDRVDAIAYHKPFFSFEYDVGEYHELTYYESRLRELGCRCTVIESPIAGTHRLGEIPRLAVRSMGRFTQYRRQQMGKLPAEIAFRIGRRYARYLTIFATRAARLIIRPSTVKSFKADYLTDFWMLLAHKHG